MNNQPVTAISKFRQIAQQRLDNHLEELRTKYNNEQPETKSLAREAFANHRDIFKKELEEEKNRLISKNDTWLSGEIDLIKQEYLYQLTLPY